MKRNLLLSVLAILFAGSIMAQAPGVAISPTYQGASMLPGTDTTVTSTIYNNTDAPINFSFPDYVVTGSRSGGGPDAYGYRWIDSDESNLSWSWTEISQTGTEVTGLMDDNIVGPFDIGFDFPFYNHTRNQFWINSNGLIQFNNALINFANGPIPTGLPTQRDFIAGLWDDLNLNDPESKVYYQNFDEQTVIQFQGVKHYMETGYVTFEIIIRINGTILINIKNFTENFITNTCTIGIQSPEANVGLQVAFNQQYIHPELTIQIKTYNEPASFVVAVEPASGEIPAWSNQPVTLTYSSVDYTPGSYQQTVQCSTTAAGFESLPIYNLMTVVSNPVIVGTIRDAQTNEALAGVTVTAGDYTTTTGPNGHYEMVVAPGIYAMSFSKEGYVTAHRDGVLAQFNHTTEVSLALARVTHFILGGTVFAGIYQLDMGYVNAFKTVEGQVVDIFADLIDTLGYYSFAELPLGAYRIKAEPAFGSQYTGSYLPTYYGDVVHWADATVLEVNQNIYNADIHLLGAVLGNNSGPGTISGYIYQAGEGKSGEAAVPAPGISIVLRQENKHAMAVSDNEGHFVFENLDLGAYTMFAEMIGKNAEFRTITLNNNNNNSATNNLFIYATDVLYGIDNSLPEGVEFMSQPYPNPAGEFTAITVNASKKVTLNIDIFAATGKQVYSTQSDLSTGTARLTLPLALLNRGIYMIRISDANGNSITRKLIKN